MPEHSAAERTEQATPERLRKAREEGRLPESQEVPSAVQIAALLAALGLGAGWLYERFASAVREALWLRGPGALGPENVLACLGAKMVSMMLLAAPFAAAAGAAAVASSALASGWAICPKALRVQMDALNPARGLRNILSARSAVRLVLSVLKLALLVGIVWQYLHDKLGECLALRWATPEATLGQMARLVFGLLLRVALAVMAVGGVDLLYQRWKHRRDLRMTRQELKEERRQHELSPEVRGRIRAVQLEMARKRMLQEVPKADVVVTNPTHVAVALRYESETMEAPKVVAKGADLLCEKIKDIARAHGVPIVHRPELARALYATVETGHVVPGALYVAVAEVLAMIYRLRRRRRT